MKVIGLTGGIGSGKSTVLSFFKDLGVATFIADVEAKKIMNADASLIQDIIHLFGENAYEKGSLNRTFISQIVFNDSSKLAQLNALVHPKVKTHFSEFLSNTSAEIVMYEAAILFESGSYKQCDYIITVTADFEERVNRVMQRDGVDRLAVETRIKHQLGDEVKILKSDFVIHNNALEATKEQVKTIFEILLKLN